MKKKIILFLFAFALWLLLCFSLDWQHIVVGVVVAFLVTVITGGLFITRPHLLKNPLRYIWFLYYIPVFIWECFKANIDMAFRVAHPDLPIKPGIVKVKTRLRSETGLTFLANSITLTPGTLTVDIDQEHSILYIHWINVSSMDIETTSQIIVTRFEKILEKIFE
ncbi:MAG: Na+/H+ antiporter subunit E [Chitinispirillaceae bacterium]|nr:Na+/H+ antiporter subunit E [Chitinispirillaceae bacterium]